MQLYYPWWKYYHPSCFVLKWIVYKMILFVHEPDEGSRWTNTIYTLDLSTHAWTSEYQSLGQICICVYTAICNYNEFNFVRPL